MNDHFSLFKSFFHAFVSVYPCVCFTYTVVHKLDGCTKWLHSPLHSKIIRLLQQVPRYHKLLSWHFLGESEGRDGRILS